jgi:hypothetical protein
MLEEASGFYELNRLPYETHLGLSYHKKEWGSLA